MPGDVWPGPYEAVVLCARRLVTATMMGRATPEWVALMDALMDALNQSKGQGETQSLGRVLASLRDMGPMPSEGGALPATVSPRPMVSASAPLIGTSPVMQPVYRAIGLVLETDITVLLTGHTGTGKDVLARLIHHQSSRRNRPFVTVNCGAIPRELIESELFGYEKGAFTGADGSKMGQFEMANQGTIFLDEVGELPLDMQVALLRVLQNREVTRVGGRTPVNLDIRVVAATNRDLTTAVANGQFRADLYYRLMVYPIRVPDLRERTEDIVPLALHFLHRFSAQYRIPFHSLSPLAHSYIQSYAWPGNIRELENTMLRALILAQGDIIMPHMMTPPSAHTEAAMPMLPVLADASSGEGPKGHDMTLADIEAQALAHAFQRHGYNVAQTAKALGISRGTFYSKAQKIGLMRSPQRAASSGPRGGLPHDDQRG